MAERADALDRAARLAPPLRGDGRGGWSGGDGMVYRARDIDCVATCAEAPDDRGAGGLWPVGGTLRATRGGTKNTNVISHVKVFSGTALTGSIDPDLAAAV
jgi:hypothetical protein